MINYKDEVLKITKELVGIPSVVNTSGESMVAQHIYVFLSGLDYFQHHADFLLKQSTINDKFERYNVLALVKGKKGVSNRTVVLMGHIDTVGIENFGNLQEVACNSDALMNAMKGISLPSNVKKDLDSGEWLFGRGALDMKSGIASHLCLIRYYAERPEELEGNLLLVAACDEEDSSHGILSAVSQLHAWKETHNLDYLGAINSDLVLPRYEGDLNRYIYKGTIGKLLPAFYVSGIETHPGDAHNSFDSNLIAAEIVREIDYNPDFIDNDTVESTLPPISLKFNDLKEGYSINIPNETLLYFNMFTLSWSPKVVRDKFINAAKVAVERAVELHKQRLKKYVLISGFQGSAAQWKPEVLSYEELYSELSSVHGDNFEKHMNNYKLSLNQMGLDSRMYAINVVREMCRWKEKNQPYVVFFFSSLYYSRVQYTHNTPKEIALEKALLESIEEIQPAYAFPIKVRNFYPYISDMSFVSLSDDEDGLSSACSDNPAWENSMFIDYKAIKSLNLPVINIGPYGHDPHLKYERTEITYTMEIVPQLIKGVIERLLNYSQM